MAFELGSAVMRLKADLTDFNKGLNQARDNVSGLTNKVESMKPTFQKMALYGTVGFTALSAGVWKVTQDASDAQEIFNKFSVVFKDVGRDAEKVAINLRNNFGLAESSAKDLLGATGDMLTGFGVSGKRALELSERTQKLAVDLASFTNYSGGAKGASEALTKALLGERESVKALGIAILEEDVKAKVQAMEVAGKFTDETEREKRAIATLEIAYSQSKNAIGDYARTSNSLANQQRTLGERFKELRESIGTAFVPILEDLVNAVVPIVNQLTQWAEKNPTLVKYIVVAVGAITGLVAVVGLLGLALPEVIVGFTLLGAIFVPLLPIIAGIALAIAGLAYVWTNNLGGIQQKTWEVIDNVKRFFNEELMPTIQVLQDYIQAHMTEIQMIFEGVWLIIQGIIEVAWAFIYGTLTIGLALLRGDWKGAWDAIKDTLSLTWAGMQKIFQGMISYVKGWAGTLFGWLVKPFEDAWHRIEDVMNKIRDALDFTKRHSPSVVDIVNKGVREVNKAMNGLEFTSTITPRMATGVVSGAGANVANVNVDMSGAIISDEMGAMRIGEKIGDQIVKKLQLSVRF